MKPSTKWFVASGSAIFLALAVLWMTWGSGQPRYDGKPLSFWLGYLMFVEFGENGDEITSGYPGAYSTLEELKADERRKAANRAIAPEAVAAIGTNCIPYLLEWLTAEESWSERMRHQLATKLGWIHPMSVPQSIVRRGQAVTAFEILKKHRDAFVPIIVDLYENGYPPELRSSAAAVLRRTAPEIMEHYDSPYYGVKRGAAEKLQISARTLDLRASTTNQLLQLLDPGRDGAVRLFAAWTLWQRDTNFASVAVETVASLHQAKQGSKYYMVHLLAEIGPRAASAMPLLIEALDPSDPYNNNLIHAALTALEAIEPSIARAALPRLKEVARSQYPGMPARKAAALARRLEQQAVLQE